MACMCRGRAHLVFTVSKHITHSSQLASAHAASVCDKLHVQQSLCHLCACGLQFCTAVPVMPCHSVQNGVWQSNYATFCVAAMLVGGLPAFYWLCACPNVAVHASPFYSFQIRHARCQSRGQRPECLCDVNLQSEQLAQHIAQRVPAAGVAALCAALATVSPAAAADFFQQPAPQSGAPTQQQQSGSPQTMDFQGSKTENAPAVKADSSGLPEGNQWRYSEFIDAVQRGKVERVRFAKDGTQLQLTAVDGVC